MVAKQGGELSLQVTHNPKIFRAFGANGKMVAKQGGNSRWRGGTLASNTADGQNVSVLEVALESDQKCRDPYQQILIEISNCVFWQQQLSVPKLTMKETYELVDTR